jgi:hypothetical protein
MKEDILTAVRLQMPLSAALDRPPGSQGCAINVSRSSGDRRVISSWVSCMRLNLPEANALDNVLYGMELMRPKYLMIHNAEHF